MLVIRKEYKVIVGVGATILGIAALYGVMSLLSGIGNRSQETNASGGDQLAAINIPDKVDNLPRGIDSAQQGLPPAEKPDGPIVAIDPSKTKDLLDQFSESNRRDGKSNDDVWTTAMNTGKVSSSSSLPLPIKSIEPARVGEIIDTTFTNRTGDRKNDTQNGKSGSTILTTGSYVVQPGDNYSRIAGKLYGNKNLYSVIEKANPGIEPTRLKPGMTIKVPPASETVSLDKGAISTEPEVIGTINTKNEYRVVSGDTLHRIAQKLYGKTAMWQSIYDANKQKIGPDAGKLKLGMVLMLPQSPSIAGN